MDKTDQPPVARRCKQRQQKGFVHIEIQVWKEDAALVRAIAAALLDTEFETSTRAFLRKNFPSPSADGLKELLESAPLEGIDLERKREFGREL